MGRNKYYPDNCLSTHAYWEEFALVLIRSCGASWWRAREFDVLIADRDRYVPLRECTMYTHNIYIDAGLRSAVGVPVLVSASIRRDRCINTRLTRRQRARHAGGSIWCMSRDVTSANSICPTTPRPFTFCSLISVVVAAILWCKLNGLVGMTTMHCPLCSHK